MSKFILTIEADSMDELLSMVSANGLTWRYEREVAPTVHPADASEGVGAENIQAPPNSFVESVEIERTSSVAEPTQPAGNDEDFDKLGMPWDERIHASSKAKNKDGTWRYKRGVDKALVEQVETKLKGGSVPTNTFPEIPEALQRGPVAPDPTPAPQTDATYEQVVAELTQALQSDPPKLTADRLPQFYLECGVADVNALRSDQNALNTAFTKLQEM